MKGLLLLIFLFTTVGSYLFLVGVQDLPTLRAGRAVTSRSKKSQALSEEIEVLLEKWTVFLSRFIRMDEYKRARMENTLRAAGITGTPEEYTAHALLKAGLYLLLMVPVTLLVPFLDILLVILMVFTYLKENGRAEEMVREKREQIEEEMYRFASTLTQELKNSRDVLSILEHYKKNAGETFRRELDVLCADMRSSSYEAALTRFEARLNSPQLSDVVRGLTGVLRGDDGTVYFQMLSHDFKQAELRRLKAKAAKIPPKIRVFSFAMLVCFLSTYFVIIIYEILNSMGTMF